MPKLTSISSFLLVSLLFISIFTTPALAYRGDPLLVELPDVPAPPGSSWNWVSRQMSYNGLPMSIKMFEVLGQYRDVEQFYSNLWKTTGHGKTDARDFGVYRIMGYELRGIYVSVQFRQEDNWVRGKIVVSESPNKRRPNFKTKLPKPPSSTVASVVESLDRGKRAETVTIESNKSVAFNKQYYENQLRSREWSLVYASGDGKNGSVQHYQKGSEQLQITIKKLTGIDNNRSEILIHWIK